MRFCWKIIALACVLFAAGCGSPITTTYPIGTTTGMVPDQRLYGTWKGVYGKDQAELYVHVVSAGDGKMLAVPVSAPERPENDGFVLILRISTAALGENRFINATDALPHSEDKPNKGSVPLLYAFSDDGRTLTISLLMEKQTMEAIKSGALAGTIKHHGKNDGSWIESDDVQITADPAALDAFMAKPEAAKLFGPFVFLKRVE